jgi:hypothetical protein
MKSRTTWWPGWTWFLAVAVTIGCGLYGGWNTFVWILLGLLTVTGLIRAWARKFTPEEWEKCLARMNPEERQKFEEILKKKREKQLARMSPEERRKFEEKLKDRVG